MSALMIRLLGVAAIAIALLVQTLRLNAAQSTIAAGKAVHERDIAIWRGAGILALSRARERAARIEAQQKEISDEVEDNAARRLAALRDGMREASRADPGGAGGSGLPRIPLSPTIFDWGSGRAVISADDARICGDNTIKAQEWLRWYRGQAGVEIVDLLIAR